MKFPKFLLGSIVWTAAVAAVAYICHSFLYVSTSELWNAIAYATAAPLFGIVLFDFKAFSRAAAEISNLVLSRLGHRACGVGSLCRPHGL